ncbi:DNA-directed RNA polymerase subunit alpha [Flammeovirga yaeyamensis]|uniref:DNA-directed RNA polymerase subunit alpha n=1 Tax=Flammeovirga yaeyamensis TaxID=367791 RepID=A0AAX1NC56_9BACT|nr:MULTISPECIES: DNA-directed RNA polymerase subunit alpha [Flammeovirga]ANQ51385.1 DNA-directed RNA polymerase subunit alpha [Flammeovirga sp. MY04]MBB3696926.1 DNA-directed RNA polymerase subunit alpha [Flammeovirga yaeyamensis]NMF33589.1 DNA-directed RNA polymerase subunit alpha [Flammeovirga yaeyamensis]QWG05143.1 DNA-directed RNA polymerase subunit alpha [Flammeovirga yaeyamensis]
MSILSFQKPERVVMDKAGDYKGLFEFKPLERGYGATIGNAFKRTLLSALEGYAIVGIKFLNTVQDSSKVAGINEELPEVLLNLKQVRLKPMIEEPVEKIIVDLNGKTEFRAGDIKEFCSQQFEVMNPDLVIATLDGTSIPQFELTISLGRGYVLAENQAINAEGDSGYISMDTTFTPIKNVDYHVENTRVEQRTDYEKLLIEIETDGTILPEVALQGAANILIQHFAQITDKEITIDMTPRSAEPKWTPEEIKKRAMLETPISELELSVRAYNSLKAGEVKTLGELVSLEVRDLMKFRNFGKKTLTELEEMLSDRDLTFGMDVSKYRLGED